MKVGEKHRALFFILFSLICFNLFSQDYSLQDIQDKLECSISWDERRERGIIFKDGKKIIFGVGIDFVVVDYKTKLNVDYIKYSEGQILFGQESFKIIESEFSNSSSKIANIKAIIIDPGHGGKDSGAISAKEIGNKFLYEKDVVLDVGLKLNAKLSNNFPNIPVIMTRDTDVFLELKERTEIANSISYGKDDIILFISLHANASLNRKASGFEVWYLTQDVKKDLVSDEIKKEVSDDLLPILRDLLDDEVSFESVLLSKKILAGLNNKIGSVSKNRGIKAEEWFVVKNTKMPAVLVEVGFVTNESEAKNLATNEYLDKVATGIYDGVVDFIDQFSVNNGWTKVDDN